MLTFPMGDALPSMPVVITQQAAQDPVDVVVLRATIRKQFALPAHWHPWRLKPVPPALAAACPGGLGLIKVYGWRRIEASDGSTEAVSGFLKLTAKAAQRIIRKNGDMNIFFDNLAQDGPRGAIDLLARDKGEDDAEYFAPASAAANGRSLAFRRGGRACL